MKTQEYQIFISYKRGSDVVSAEKIYKALNEKGYSVFWDRAGIGRGEQYNAIIENAIWSSNVFILLLSRSILNAVNIAQTENKEQPYIKKVEVPMALQCLRRKGKESFHILPFIIDNSDPEEYSPVFSDLFKEISINNDTISIESIIEDICNLLNSKEIFPNQEAHQLYELTKESENIRNIVPLMWTIINDCRTCIRSVSNEEGIRCPFLQDIANADDRHIFERESRERTEDNFLKYDVSEPIKPEVICDSEEQREVYPDLLEIWENERQMWEKDRETACIVDPKDIQNEYEAKYGEGHSGTSISRPCKNQVDRINSLEQYLKVFNIPIAQQVLIKFQTDIEQFEGELVDNEVSKIQRKTGLFTYVQFLKLQIRRIWRFKEDVLESLSREKGFDSIYGMLIGSLNETIITLNNAISKHSSIASDQSSCFEIVWWLLRNNSNILTQKVVSFLSSEERKYLCNLLNEFCALYDFIKTSSATVLFDSVLPSFFFCYPDDDVNCLAYRYFGLTVDQFKWNDLIDWEEFIEDNQDKHNSIELSYVMASDLDKQKNPVDAALFGLCRGVSSPPMNITIEKLINVSAVNYLYPLAKYCRNFINIVKNEDWTANIDLIPGRESIYFSFFDFGSPYRDCDEGDAHKVSHYHGLLYRTDNKWRNTFNTAIEEITVGNRNNGFSILKSLVKENYLDAIVYLANSYAYGPTPNIPQAISLFEFAAERGVEFCFSRLAECYERQGDFAQAYRWQLMSQKYFPGVENNLRQGVCLYHLDKLTESVDCFNKAGEIGQAAKFFLGMYGSRLENKIKMNDHKYEASICNEGSLAQDLKESESYEQLLISLQTKIKMADSLLGNYCQIPEEYSIQNENDIGAILQRAKDNDIQAQFIYGLIRMKDYFFSDEFLDHAMGWIKVAANNGNPDALCLLGRYMQKYQNNYQIGKQFFSRAIRIIYTKPFPELSSPK